MYKFFRENQKRLLAVFGVILMIAFIMPTTMKSQTSDVERVQGKIGSENISREQIRQAEEEWQFLDHNLVIQGSPSSQEQWQPITQLFPQELTFSVRQNPETYFLLQYEAKKMGFVPKLEDADRNLNDSNIAFRMPDGRVLTAENLNDLAAKEAGRQYLANLLMVSDAFGRAARSVKVSNPLVEHMMASQFQTIKVRVVDFLAKDYEATIAAPSADDLKKTFDQFADTLEDSAPTSANPFGFGYKYPNRVKLQYIGIPRTEVRKAIQARQTDYQWEVEANRYYLQHTAEFISTTQPATQEALSLGGTTRPSMPTTKPFTQVREEILSRIIDPQVDKLAAQIQADLTIWLNRDYDAWSKTHPNGPTTAVSTMPPATAPGSAPGFESYEYLQKLAQDIQTRYKVTLTAGSATDSFKSTKELQFLPGIGQVPSFADYAVAGAEAFVPAAQKSHADVLKVFKTSRVLADDSRNAYFFRITATDASHKPASVDEVKDQVEHDWKRVKTLDAAKADAAKLLEAATTTELEKVAGDRKVIQTGEYAVNAPGIENYPLSTRAQSDFVHKTYAMLESLANQSSKRPVTLVELPADNKVAVTELVFVNNMIKPEIKQMITDNYQQQLARQFQMSMANNWFDYESIVERVGYSDLTKSKAGGKAAQPVED